MQVVGLLPIVVLKEVKKYTKLQRHAMKKINILFTLLILFPMFVQASQVKDAQNQRQCKVKKYIKLGLKGFSGFLLGQCALNLLNISGDQYQFKHVQGSTWKNDLTSGHIERWGNVLDEFQPGVFVRKYVMDGGLCFENLFILRFGYIHSLLWSVCNLIGKIIPVSNDCQANSIAAVSLACLFSYGSYKCLAALVKDVREKLKKKPEEATV